MCWWLFGNRIKVLFQAERGDLVKNEISFPKIRLALDHLAIALHNERNTLLHGYSSDRAMNELILALYEEVNVYWLSRGLKTLSDPDVPDNMKRAILKELEENKKYE